MPGGRPVIEGTPTTDGGTSAGPVNPIWVDQAWANPLWGDDWEEVRRLWLLDPEVAHCNHGSFGALPARVLASQNEFRSRMAANPMRWFDREMPDLLTAALTEVAQFIGANPEDVAFVNNVSAGVSAVAQSLPLNPGDEVLSTDHAYGAVSSALDRLCARTGATRVIAKVPLASTDEEVVAVFAAHCSERTALVVIDQVTSPTARRFPIEAVAALAHRFGAAVLVDAAHAPGMLPVRSPQARGRFLGWQPAQVGLRAGGYGRALGGLALAATNAVAGGVLGRNGRFPVDPSSGSVPMTSQPGWRHPGRCDLLASLGWDRLRAHNEALVRCRPGHSGGDTGLGAW